MGLFSRKPKSNATDPVCGMSVQPSSAAGSILHQGTTYYFCSAACMESFRKEPAHYVG